MFKTFSFRRVIQGAVLGVGALAAATGTAQAGKLAIGHFIWVGYGPLYLARDLGYFKENGLEVDIKVLDDTSLIMAAQAAGKLSGAASTIDDVLKYRSDNFCFKAVLTLDDSAGGDGIVATSDIKTLADLKGKTVALNEGSTSQFFISYLMKKEGIPLDSITTSNMTADDAAAAFIAGRVPAAVTWEPNLTLVKTKNVGHVVLDSTKAPGVIVDVVELSCSVIEKQPEDVKALVAGYYKALDYMKAHPKEADAIMAKGVGGYLSKPEDFADAETGVRFYDKPMNVAYMGAPGKPGAIADVIKLANEIWTDLGRIKDGHVGYDDIVDPSFVGE